MIPSCKWWFGGSALDLVCLLQLLFLEGFRPGDLGGCWLSSDLSYGFLLSWMFGHVSCWLPHELLCFYGLLVILCWFPWSSALLMSAILFAPPWRFWLILHPVAAFSMAAMEVMAIGEIPTWHTYWELISCVLLQVLCFGFCLNWLFWPWSVLQGGFQNWSSFL